METSILFQSTLFSCLLKKLLNQNNDVLESWNYTNKEIGIFCKKFPGVMSFSFEKGKNMDNYNKFYSLLMKLKLSGKGKNPESSFTGLISSIGKPTWKFDIGNVHFRVKGVKIFLCEEDVTFFFTYGNHIEYYRRNSKLRFCKRNIKDMYVDSKNTTTLFSRKYITDLKKQLFSKNITFI